MKKVSIENVRISIRDNNGNFAMAPFLNNMNIFFEGTESENPDNNVKGMIKSYQIKEEGNNLLVDITAADESEYSVNSFAPQYIQFLNKINCNTIDLIVQCRQQDKNFISTCRIFELNIVCKNKDEYIFAPPIAGLKVFGTGIVNGHKYIKNGFGKSSKIVEVNHCARTIKSTRTIYEILSLSPDYEKYLMDILSNVETILHYYSI